MTARVARLSYFFPAHNEEANLAGLVEEALEALPRLADTFEIIAVDDGSRDRTGPSPTNWQRRTPISSASSTTRRTWATAPRSARASGPPATSSSPSPTATGSSASRTSAA